MDKLTLFIACWGALISSAVLIWDVYKWAKSRRPQLVITANGHMIDVNPQNRDKTYIAVSVTNVGDKPTTLQLITYRFYKTKPKRWRTQKADSRGFFRLPENASSPLPHKLDVGEVWSGIFEQTKDIQEMAMEGYFYFEAADASNSDARKHARSRLVLDQTLIK